jgi:glycosyltransferase involved in cell wall biosynthesis
MKELDQNKIDVVIPVYNGAKFILQALESVVNQTLSPRRIIIVDDGSTDNTYELVVKYAENSRVEIKIISKNNGGLSSARNAGIKESDGDFIAFLDADDSWVKNKLEEQISLFEKTKFKNLALIYCDYDVINSNGDILFKNYKAPLDDKRMRGSVFKTLLSRNQIASSGSGVLIKREVFETVGLFDENLKFGEDWDMWLRISERYEIDFVDKVLVHIRKHGQNMTSNPSKIFEKELGFYGKWISHIRGRHPVPALWADKILFRIVTGLPDNLFKILKDKLPRSEYRDLFARTFGSLLLHIPLFLIRQILNIFFYPKYISIIIGFIKYRGK